MSKHIDAIRMFVLPFVLFLAAGACEEPMRLRFEIITPAGFDWTRLDRLVVSAGGRTQEIRCENAACPFSVKFRFQEGEHVRVLVQGYSSGDRLAAVGYSPYFYTTGQAMNLAVFLSEINTGAVIDTEFEAPAAGARLMTYRSRLSDELSANAGTLFFGGAESHTQDATPLDVVGFYDPYLLALVPLSPLSIPLADPVVMDLHDGNYLIYGGRTTGGRLSGGLLFYSTTSLQASGSHVISLPPESAPPPMAGAQAIEIGPFDRLYDNATGRYLLDAFIVFGGTVADAEQTPVTWFAVYYNTASAVTTIETIVTDVSIPAGTQGAALRASDTEMRVALPQARMFLSAAVRTTPSGLEFRLEPHELPDVPAAQGWRVIACNGRLLGLSGRDENQDCQAQWFAFSAEDFSAAELSGAVGHCESTLVCLGKVVLEIGGRAPGGQVHGASMRTVSAQNGEPTDLADEQPVPMQRERIAPQAFVLPTGAVAVFGGQDPVSGDPVPALEMIVLDPSMTGEPQ